jgi:hypothetical protein
MRHLRKHARQGKFRVDWSTASYSSAVAEVGWLVAYGGWGASSNAKPDQSPAT